MEKGQLKELKKIANELKPQFNIGKNGITDTFIESIDNYVQAHQIVKIKCMNTTDKEEVKAQAEEIAKSIDCEVIDIKGFTFVLFRD